MAYVYIGIACLCLLVIYGGISWLLPDRICTIQAPGLKSDRRQL